jgi:hypothetical protein
MAVPSATLRLALMELLARNQMLQDHHRQLFVGERPRPFVDLAGGGVAAEQPGYVVDLRCGPGPLTADTGALAKPEPLIAVAQLGCCFGGQLRLRVEFAQTVPGEVH